MNVFFRQTADGVEWLKTSDEAITSEYFTGSMEDFARFYAAEETPAHWVMIQSALSTIYRQFSFTAKEKRHIQQAVPFMLEEDVATEIDQLHLVTHKVEDLTLGVVAVERQALQNSLAELKDNQVTPSHCLSSFHFIPQTEADWVMVCQNDESLLKTKDGLYAIDQNNLPQLLALLTEGFSTLPNSIELLTFSETDAQAVLSLLPEVIRNLIEVKQEDYGKHLQASLKQAKKWNLLTGQYATSENILERVKPWRWVIAGLACLYCFDIGLSWMQSNTYQSEYQDVRKNTTALFRQVVPRGVMVDPKRQLNQILKNSEEQGGVRFSMLVSQLVPTFAQYNTDINSMNYDKGKSELRLDMVVKDFTELEAIMDALKKAKLTPEIQNSSQQEDKLRVRLRIGAKS